VPGNLTVALLLPERQYKWRQWKWLLCAWRYCCKVPETETDALQRVSSLLENYIHLKVPHTLSLKINSISLSFNLHVKYDYVWGQTVTAVKPVGFLILHLTKLMQKIHINICQNEDMKNLEYLWYQLLVIRVLAMTSKLSDVFVVLASLILCYFNSVDYLISDIKYVNTRWCKSWLMWVDIF
jgi:hypothetical protein